MGPQLLLPLSPPAWRATQIELCTPHQDMADETVYQVFDQPEDDHPGLKILLFAKNWIGTPISLMLTAILHAFYYLHLLTFDSNYTINRYFDV
jgi:hypothetical protein